MVPVSEGCRLCLDTFAECFTTIDNPQLKDQMEKVFCFSVEPKQGYCSGVCQSCSYAISEFYQYSEKVRQNQEVLSGTVTNNDLIVDSRITLENVKVETLSNSGLPETTHDAFESKDEVPGEEEVPTVNSKITLESVNVVLPETIEDGCGLKNEVSEEEEEEAPNYGHDETYEPPSKKSQISRKGRPRGRPRKRKLDDLEAGEPTKTSKQTTRKTIQERKEEDRLFNKHFRMICDLCKTSVGTFTELRSHFKKEHQRLFCYVVCCNKKLYKRHVIREHIDFHADPDVFRCEICGNRYKNKISLNEHMLCKHSNAGPFKCNLCSQSFAQKTALAQHKERHMSFKCPECNNMFACKRSLRFHMTTQHSGKDRRMICGTCGREFLTKRCFDLHMKEHMGIEIQRLQCGICQRWLKGERNLRLHMNALHPDGNREFQCDICLQKYPHNRALQCHKLMTHAEPQHECEFCGKKFKKAVALKEHRITHTDEAVSIVE